MSYCSNTRYGTLGEEGIIFDRGPNGMLASGVHSAVDANSILRLYGQLEMTRTPKFGVKICQHGQIGDWDHFIADLVAAAKCPRIPFSAVFGFGRVRGKHQQGVWAAFFRADSARLLAAMRLRAAF
jgi:hypothetical protein